MTRDEPGAGGWSIGRVTAILDLVRDGVLVVDADDVIVYTNPVVAERLGAPPATLVGRRLFDLLAGLRGSSVPEHLQLLRTRGGEITVEEYVSVLGGWFHMVAAADETRPGEVTIFVRETTGQRRADRLRDLVGRLSRVVDGAPRMHEAILAAAGLMRRELGFDVVEAWTVAGSGGRLRFLAADRSVQTTAAGSDDDLRTRGADPTSPVVRAAASTAVVTATQPATDGERWHALYGRMWIDRGDDLVLGLWRREPLEADDALALFDGVRPLLASLLGRRRADLEFEQFFQLSREYVAITGVDGEFRRVNPAMVRGLGFSEAELGRLGFEGLVHPDDRARTANAIATAMRTSEPVDRFENRVLSSTGEYRWISWGAQAFGDEQIVFSTGRDVTRERNDRLFREGQNEVLQALLAGEPLTQTLAKIATLLETMYPAVRCRIELHDEPLSVGRVHEPDDGDVDARQWHFPIEADGQPVGTLTVSSTSLLDPTADQFALADAVVGLAGLAVQRSRADAALSASEERFRLLAEVITDAIFDWDPVAGWRSDGFHRLLGHADDEVDDGWWIDHLHPDEVDDVLGTRRRALSGGNDLWVSEHRQRRADGGYADVAVRGRILRDAAGKALRMVGGMSDVTERRDLERQYLRAQRVESLGTLAGGIAHDLNNSLMPILMAIDLLRSEDLDEEAAELVDVIAHSAERSAGMVRNILTFARGVEGSRTVLDIDEVVEGTARIVRDTFPKHVTLDVRSSAGALRVRGDATQLHQVVLNFALNARDSMPDGGRLMITVDEVDIGPRPPAAPDAEAVVADLLPGRYARVRVSDTGPGITPAVRDRLFEPFFTTKARAEGTGLGLPTALAIARAHGGGIGVSTVVGGGSSFDLFVPLATEASAPTWVIHSDRDDDARPGAGELVVVVDDEPVIRTVVREVLEGAGYRVVEASEGEQALDLLARDRPALVITDVMMPGLDGVGLTQRLRERGDDVPVVAMTGLVDDQRRAALRDAGVTDVLAKPFDRTALLVMVSEVLRRPPP